MSAVGIVGQVDVTTVAEGDAALLAAVRLGNEAAFEALFRRYYARVHGIVFRLAPDEADDLAQEVFLRLYRRPPANKDSDLGAWLYRVAVNAGYNALRRSRGQTRGIDTLRAGVESDWRAAQGARSTEECVAQREEQQRVRAALRSIGRRQATLLVLRHSGLSYRQVAAAVGVAPGSVGTLLARAERALQRAYERQGTGSGERGG